MAIHAQRCAKLQYVQEGLNGHSRAATSYLTQGVRRLRSETDEQEQRGVCLAMMRIILAKGQLVGQVAVVDEQVDREQLTAV